MKNHLLILTPFLIFLHFSLWGQTYDTILKGGHVIDPKNNIDRVVDVAIKDGKIAAVSSNIDVKSSGQVIDVSGLYITPGLLDIHGHVFAGTEPDHAYSNGFSSVSPDGFTFRVGVTTIVDCGGAGWKSFPVFKENIIDKSKTRVLAFLNIVGEGMRGGAYEQDVQDMDSKLAAFVARQFPEYIIGIKVAHFRYPDFVAVERAVEAGKLANIPVMVDFGGTKPRLSLEELFMEKLRRGDIFTHTFGELIETKETVVNVETNKLEPFVLEARKKGIIFDVGHGYQSFAFSQALPAAQAGFYPETISTDLHINSMNGAMKDMLNVMSKFLALKMNLPNVIRASTWAPAQAIKREELGHLSIGAVADIAVLNLRQGKFGFFDVDGGKMEGNQLLECEMTYKDGEIVYDLNGRSILDNILTF